MRKNSDMMTLELRRIDVCDLLIATGLLREEGLKWGCLHDVLLEQLDRFDGVAFEEEDEI